MLVTFLVFALLAFVVMVGLLWYFLPSSRVVTSVPGLGPSHQTLGNLPNVADAGGLPQFLRNLHCDYGTIASFWLGDYLAISVGSYSLFKQVDKSCPNNGLPYQTIVPLTLDKDILKKTTKSEAYLNSIMASFAPFSQPCSPTVSEQVAKLTKELCEVLGKTGTEDQVPIQDYITALSVKVVAQTFLNKTCDVAQLRLNYTNLVIELEALLEVDRELGEIKRNLLNKRVNEFIDCVGESNGPNTFGLITVISVLSTWVLYYLARHADLQSKVLSDLNLLKNFLAEVVRVTGFIPFTARVLNKQDLNILGHTLEEGTLVINSLSNVCWDGHVFSDPETINLDRDFHKLPDIFQCINNLAADSYSYCVIAAIVKTVLSAFKLNLAAPEVKIGPKFCFVMKPELDIWLTLQKK